MDDNFDQHPKVVGLRGDPLCEVDRQRGQWARLFRESAACWCGRLNTDGVIPVAIIPTIATNALLTTVEAATAIDLLVSQQILEKRTKRQGGGWQIHDWLEYNRSKQQVDLTEDRAKRRKALYATKQGRDIVAAVRRRDGDRCRYCWSEVKWEDRRSAQRGTMDHVDPDGPNSVDNVVVACGSCNRRKWDRTPEEAEMSLKEPYFGDDSDLAVSAREQYANSSRTVLMRGSGRVRSGQVDSGAGQVDSGASLSGSGAPPPDDRHYPGEVS